MQETIKWVLTISRFSKFFQSWMKHYAHIRNMVFKIEKENIFHGSQTCLKLANTLLKPVNGLVFVINKIKKLVP